MHGLLQYCWSQSNHMFFLRSMHIRYCVFPWHRGEKTALDTWKFNNNLTQSFQTVTVAPSNITSYISTIESFNLLPVCCQVWWIKGGVVRHTNNKGCPYGPHQIMCISECVIWGITFQLAPTRTPFSFKVGIELIQDNSSLYALRFRRQSNKI